MLFCLLIYFAWYKMCSMSRVQNTVTIYNGNVRSLPLVKGRRNRGVISGIPGFLLWPWVVCLQRFLFALTESVKLLEKQKVDTFYLLRKDEAVTWILASLRYAKDWVETLYKHNHKFKIKASSNAMKKKPKPLPDFLRMNFIYKRWKCKGIQRQAKIEKKNGKKKTAVRLSSIRPKFTWTSLCVYFHLVKWIVTLKHIQIHFI